LSTIRLRKRANITNPLPDPLTLTPTILGKFSCSQGNIPKELSGGKRGSVRIPDCRTMESYYEVKHVEAIIIIIIIIVIIIFVYYYQLTGATWYSWANSKRPTCNAK